MKYRDYYEVLEVPRSAETETIKKAFRRLARTYHPDVNPGDQTAEAKFKEINEAYTVLSDPDKRQRYDQLGPNWQNGSDFTPPPDWSGYGSHTATTGNSFGFGGQTFDFSEFFKAFFGGGGVQSASRYAGSPVKGQNFEAELPLTLQQIHHGGRHSFTYTGLDKKPHQIDVHVPLGVRSGTTIRLAGMGGAGIGAKTAGDLFLKIKVVLDPIFAIIGRDDLQIELAVTPWEAVLGAEVQVPTVAGKVAMTIPPGTQTGQRMRLRGQGLNRLNGRGDQYVKIRIVVPTRPTDRERELFDKLAKESAFNPRVS